MNIKEKLKDLVSSAEEFDSLYNSDTIYIVKGNHPDDNNLIKINENKIYDWKNKLRGPYEGPAKLANNENTHDWCHGYIWGVSNENVPAFEQSIIFSGLETGYNFEKINVAKGREEEKRMMFNSLFIEN